MADGAQGIETCSLQDICRQLRPAELEFLAARMHCSTDKEAAAEVGMELHTVYTWSNKPLLNRALQLAKLDGVEVAREVLRRGATKAAKRMVKGLDAYDGGQALRAAAEILDRVGLQAPKEVTLGGSLVINIAPRPDGR